MKFNITIEESPFGDKGVVYEGDLGMIQHFRLQLISYRTQNLTKKERAALEADIKGYEMLLESKSEKNAQVFIEAKRGEKFEKGGFKELFKNNIEVIEHLKATGNWDMGS